MSGQNRLTPVINKMEIQARVCPRGHVYLYVGHTCLFLQQDEFLDIAQIVHAVERHLRKDSDERANEPSH
jgi:hypothetical protein